MYARPSAKLVRGRRASTISSTTAPGSPGFAAGEIGQVPSDPDIAAIPDLASFTPVPWQPNLARFACDITVEGEPWPYCPRTICAASSRRRRSRASSSRWGSSSSTSSSSSATTARSRSPTRSTPSRSPATTCAGLTRRYDFLTTVSRYCNELGWGNYANDHEDANGQFEQNFTYDDALVSCDRAIFFRYMVHTLAEQHGMIATFMPKPFTHLTGNGCHFHMSLWDGDTNLFLDEADPRGLGLSETAYHFIGGLKAHARAYSARDRADGQLVQAAQARARRRAARRGRPSGSRTATTTARRCSASPGRGGSRTARSTARATRTSPRRPCSPPASTGSRTGLDAGEPNSENLYASRYDELRARGLEALPANLLEAVGELERDDVLRAALGRGRDEDYVDCYARVKRDEWFRYHEQVTPWEIREYLTRF